MLESSLKVLTTSVCVPEGKLLTTSHFEIKHIWHTPKLRAALRVYCGEWGEMVSREIWSFHLFQEMSVYQTPVF